MIHDQHLEFHNVAELVVTSASQGRRLQRLPESLRPTLNPTARAVACSPTHCEIRYVSDAPCVSITLHSEIHHEYIRIYQGDFFQQEICLEPGQTRTLELSRNTQLLQHAAQLRPDETKGFSTEVMRLRLSGTGRVCFLHADANGFPLRPPTAVEKPARTLLAYGSSITQGFSSSRMSTAFIAQASHRLGFDFLNLGSGGSCHCEPEMGDYLAARSDWHVAWLELGINLLGAVPKVTDEKFSELASGILEKTSRNPHRCVIATTHFPGGHDLPHAPRPAEPWRQIIRELVQKLARPNLHLIEGTDLLDWNGLTTDLCHPSDDGHAMISQRLVAYLNSISQQF